MPGKRRAPRRHTVHTRDPRYSVDSYDRGKTIKLSPSHELRFNDNSDLELGVKKPKLEFLMDEVFEDLRVFEKTPHQMEYDPRGYKYLVTGYAATSHAAFKTRSGLMKWLKERGLKPEKKITSGEIVHLQGKYHSVSFKGTQKDLDAFAREKNAKPIRVLDNGSYVRGYSMKTGDGYAILYMNPNYQRRVLKYSHS